jgi:hypothetical protein
MTPALRPLENATIPPKSRSKSNDYAGFSDRLVENLAVGQTLKAFVS